MLSSTMETVDVCCKCNKQLKETEVHFYGDKCTECIYQEIQIIIKEGANETKNR